MREAVLDIYFGEVRDHIFRLVFGVVDFFDSVEDDNHNDLMRHDSSIIKEVTVAFLYALDGRLKHVLWLTVYTDTNGQLNPPLRSSLEE
jgi:hypothetical protein